MQKTQQSNLADSAEHRDPASAGNSPMVHGRAGRINFIRVIFVLLFVAIVVKLGVVQGVNGFYYKRVAQRQYESQVVLRANRGMIYDRNGNLIVSNIYGYSYAADPELLNASDRIRIAKKFASVFNLPASLFMDKMNAKSRFVWLARNIDSDQSSALQGFDVCGLIRLKEQQRLYPYGASAGQVLGFTNVDGKGASGAELEFDSLLAGKDGYEIMQLDGIGRKMSSVDYPHVDPVPGCNLQLTLDMNLEQIVEDELSAGVEAVKGTAGTAVFMNPNTGEILAIANYPSFNPSEYDKYTPDDSRDRAITDVFEPGSTFKIVTAAAALQEGIEKPNDIIFAENGRYIVFGRLIEDFEHVGWITFRQAVELSSNVAFSKVGMKIPPDKFYRYARDFGFGAATGLELPGEVSGELEKPYEWSRVSLPFMSFGYEVMVTALQMADAYAAVANGGTLMRPYIVNEITDPKGNVLFQNSPAAIRRVVSANISQTLTGLFVDVVEHGTGTSAKLSDVLLAGKTGTAQKLVDGMYSKKFYRASFAGFFPVPNPQIVGFIMVDSPLDGYTGGMVSAPIFKKIASRIYGIMQRRTSDFSNDDVRLVSNSSRNNKMISGSEDGNPQFTAAKEENTKINSGTIGSSFAAGDMVTIPDVSFLDYKSAEEILQSHDLFADDPSVVADPSHTSASSSPASKTSAACPVFTLSDQSSFIVESEKPAAGSAVPKGTSVKLNLVLAKRITKMPNFRGTSVRMAASFFLSAGIPFHVVGSGRVVSQFPDAGKPISKNTSAVINCDDKSLNMSGLF
ncbi:MAG: penicillin-binding transpeptidase domain-containing protein [Candidatus Kryptoniota bacterium]